MSVEEFATTVLWLTWLIAPAIVFFFGNSFTSPLRVLLHALLAVASGWALAVTYVVSAQSLIAYRAVPERLEHLYASDGAPAAFAAVFGWIPAALTVATLWVTRTLWLRRRRAEQGSN
jgi:hypothetical protein